MKEQELISCAPSELYGRGGFYDPHVEISHLIENSKRYANQVKVISEIFPGQVINRNKPNISISKNISFLKSVDDHFQYIQSTFNYISPSLLVCIRHAVIWQNMLFAVLNGRAIPIYEFYRFNDRNEKGRHLLSSLAACEHRERLDLGEMNALFVGSAGSFNYGHWLTDDFPSLAAGRELRRNGRSMMVLMSSYFGDIDRTRIEGSALALGERNDYCVKMLNRNKAYHVRNLYYVTPSTYHPHMKNPHALRFVRETCTQTLFDEPSCTPSNKLFVNRSEGEPRRLLNNDAVVEQMTALGFAEVFTDKLSLREQWATFAGAREIVGIMGAAMTSTLLCPVGTSLTYLAPVGWIEPFYWNLAAMSDQPYSVLFGEADESAAENYRKNFSIDVAQLTEHLSRQ